MKHLPKNISESQANIRFFIGCVLVVLAFWYHGWILLVLGLVLVITGHYQFCPPCSIFKIPGVCKKDK